MHEMHDEEMVEEQRLRLTQLAEEKRQREEQIELLMWLVGGSTCRGEDSSFEESHISERK